MFEQFYHDRNMPVTQGRFFGRDSSSPYNAIFSYVGLVCDENAPRGVSNEMMAAIGPSEEVSVLEEELAELDTQMEIAKDNGDNTDTLKEARIMIQRQLKSARQKHRKETATILRREHFKTRNAEELERHMRGIHQPLQPPEPVIFALPERRYIASITNDLFNDAFSRDQIVQRKVDTINAWVAYAGKTDPKEPRTSPPAPTMPTSLPQTPPGPPTPQMLVQPQFPQAPMQQFIPSPPAMQHYLPSPPPSEVAMHPHDAAPIAASLSYTSMIPTVQQPRYPPPVTRDPRPPFGPAAGAWPPTAAGPGAMDIDAVDPHAHNAVHQPQPLAPEPASHPQIYCPFCKKCFTRTTNMTGCANNHLRNRLTAAVACPMAECESQHVVLPNEDAFRDHLKVIHKRPLGRRLSGWPGVAAPGPQLVAGQGFQSGTLSWTPVQTCLAY